MGNNPSKTNGTSTPKRSGSSASLDRPPTDNVNGEGKESRGFKAFRNKRTSSKNNVIDSPRNSIGGLSRDFDADKSDVSSIKSGRSNRSAMSRGYNASFSEPEKPTEDEVVQPPPSPTQSQSVGHGHQDIESGQQAGVIEHVSDKPPSGAADSHAHLKQPGKSILVRQSSAPEGIEAVIAQTLAEANQGGPSMGMTEIQKSDLDDYINRLLDAAYAGKVTKGLCLKNAEITAICSKAREVFLSQPALLELEAPVKIVGDIHGQYTDLIRMFEMCGFPPNSNFLFLGDYVDRGKQSLETILLLLCYKLKFPENFFLLRGNHECANVTRVYGFYDECKRRCNIKIWKTFIDTFNTLPIAAIVAGKIFCVHGGLSPSLSHMDDIRNIARPTDVPDYGLLNDLLWSDPADMEQDWETNERGVSYCFGKKVITDFLTRHDFDLVCRAHMVVEDGYEFFNDRVLVTVFSAPNYCGEFDNWGAVMSVSSELLCSFELLKPLDSSALKNHIKKGRSKRQTMLNSPPPGIMPQSM